MELGGTVIRIVDTFTKQFEPHGDGYIYYPSRREGGKFVTEKEHQDLLAEWKRTATGRGFWISMLLIIGLVAIWSVFRLTFVVPEWASATVTIGIAVLILVRVGWASLAPRRLVKGRPDITPRRTLGEAQSQAARLMPWSMVIGVIVGSGVIIGILLSSITGTWEWWAWTIGSGGVLISYVWIAVRKYQSRS
ncbi:hypothetical protein HFP51_12905 [Parasphingopyxis sp. CP4]|uniref:hypothetical protein n=1 Tax=Parasphingopyxis sp. CP4 TaxID=2724527 RepID=UPI0015A34132|nr:hypothetical protein [Parasphingopyxis sp. CP4]QLC23006.1 hypothetical protein HFP51_12905 [Parasphingopyxis sp. CP4]